jgi:putative Mn2+ efflux pump MntP
MPMEFPSRNESLAGTNIYSVSSLLFLALFALLQNIDNLILAGAYRLRNVTIGLQSNLIIAVLSGLVSAASVTLAQVTTFETSSLGLGSATELIGRGILVMIGVWTLIAYFRAKLFNDFNGSVRTKDDSDNEPATGSRDQARPMGLSEAMISGTALAIDNVAPSFAFGLVNAGHQNLAAVGIVLGLFTGALSLVSVGLGQRAGAGSRLRLRLISPEFASGCLMIVLAIFDPSEIGFHIFGSH